MEYTAKNYTEQGGEKTVIGGALEIQEGASVTGLPPATITPAANQLASTATTIAGLKDDFNTLLAALKAAGFIAADPITEE